MRIIYGLFAVIVGAICLNCTQQKQPTFEKEDKNAEISIMEKSSDLNTTTALVCLLSGKEFIERKELLQKEIFSQLKNTEEIEDGFILYFSFDEEFILKLMDYIISEIKCCPFFTFDTKLHANTDIRLIVTGPQQAKEMLRVVLEK